MPHSPYMSHTLYSAYLVPQPLHAIPSHSTAPAHSTAPRTNAAPILHRRRRPGSYLINAQARMREREALAKKHAELGPCRNSPSSESEEPTDRQQLQQKTATSSLPRVSPHDPFPTMRILCCAGLPV